MSVVRFGTLCAMLLSSCSTAPRHSSLSATGSVTPSPGAACAYDRGAMLALSLSDFDQDMEGGWRKIAYDDECVAIAADLIRDYRESKGLSAYLLYWHEGQLRASAGQTGRAVGLFQLSYKPPETDQEGWNFYVDATIAFLKKDQTALLGARERLASLPRPKDFAPRDPEGRPVAISWPMNLHVVDAMIRCFGRSYDEAYSGCSNPPS